MLNGQVPPPCCGISQLWRSPLRSEGSREHTWLPSPRCQVWEEASPQHLAVQTSGDRAQGRRRAAGDRHGVLTLCTGLLLSETLGSGTDGSSMSARDAQGETERTGLGVGAGGTGGGWLSDATKGLVGATAPCRVRPTPSWQKQAGAGCELSIHLVLPRPRFAQLTR